MVTKETLQTSSQTAHFCMPNEHRIFVCQNIVIFIIFYAGNLHFINIFSENNHQITGSKFGIAWLNVVDRGPPEGHSIHTILTPYHTAIDWMNDLLLRIRNVNYWLQATHHECSLCEIVFFYLSVFAFHLIQAYFLLVKKSLWSTLGLTKLIRTHPLQRKTNKVNFDVCEWSCFSCQHND